MARRTRSLTVTRLEGRDLMAGQVTAFVSHDVLHVREPNLPSAAVNQAVSINRLNNETIRVFGMRDRDGVPTLVNGVNFQDFALPAGGSLSVKLGGGNDLVSVTGGELDAVTIDVRSPDPGHADVDEVSLFNTQTRAGIRITTGGGADKVGVFNVRVGDGVGQAPDSLVINTGSGADQVNVGTTEVLGPPVIGPPQGFPGQGGSQVLEPVVIVPDQPVTVRTDLVITTFRTATEADADSVRLENVDVGRATRVLTGGGADAVTLSDMAGQDLLAATGLGNDTIQMKAVSLTGRLVVRAGDGNDTLDLPGVRAAYLMADGGSGHDQVTGLASATIETRQILRWESFGAILPPERGGGGGLLGL